MPRFTVCKASLLLSPLALAALLLRGGFAEPAAERRFEGAVQPFLKKYCISCHSGDKPKAKLDLSVHTSATAVAKNERIWETVIERLEANQMPPEKAPRQPTPHERRSVLDWLRDFREQEAQQNAGDPGRVPARRLSNDEFDYTIRDLTGVDIRPT